jgi:metal-responsive CopG/Arc/MetJ family transcriptional regulator
MSARIATRQLIHLYLDKALLKHLDKLAKKYGLTRSDVIRAALVYYLEKGIKPEKGGE